MLAGQQRGGHQHRRLVAVLDRLEHRPDRHLGLAEAHVAADQPVHGQGPLHVRLDLLDGPQLVGGLDEGEGRLELGLPRGVGSEGVAGDLQSPAVQGHQLLGDLVHRGPGLGPGLLPLRATQSADRGRVAPGVGGEQLDLVGGQVEPVAAPVLEEQVVAGGAAHGPGDHAPVAGHPVLAVDDVAARGQIVEEPVHRAGPGAGLAVGPAATGDVGLGQHGHLGRRAARSPGRPRPPRSGPRARSGRVGRWPARRGSATTGTTSSSSARMPERRSAPPGRRRAQHHRVVRPRPAPATWAASLAPSPRMGSHPRRSTRGTSGPSAVGTSETTAGRRPGQQPVEGDVQPRGVVTLLEAPGGGQGVGQRRLLLEQLTGPVPHPPGLDQDDQGVRRPAGRRPAPRSRSATAATTPSRRTARRRPGGPTGGGPTGWMPTRPAARSRMASSATSSRQPNSSTAPRSSMDRWSATSNRVSRSTSSPHRSIRTGSSAVEGKTSTIPPRTASSPRCSTIDSRR